MKNGKKRPTHHHMLPKSRFPELIRKKWNIKEVPSNKHQAWHLLFNDRTPWEAIVVILKEWTPKEMQQECVDYLIQYIKDNPESLAPRS